MEESAFAAKGDFSIKCLSFRAFKKSWRKSVQQFVIISFTLPHTNSENDKSKSNFFPLVYSFNRLSIGRFLYSRNCAVANDAQMKDTAPILKGSLWSIKTLRKGEVQFHNGCDGEFSPEPKGRHPKEWPPTWHLEGD